MGRARADTKPCCSTLNPRVNNGKSWQAIKSSSSYWELKHELLAPKKGRIRFSWHVCMIIDAFMTTIAWKHTAEDEARFTMAEGAAGRHTQEQRGRL